MTEISQLSNFVSHHCLTYSIRKTNEISSFIDLCPDTRSLSNGELSILKIEIRALLHLDWKRRIWTIFEGEKSMIRNWKFASLMVTIDETKKKHHCSDSIITVELYGIFERLRIPSVDHLEISFSHEHWKRKSLSVP